MKSNYIRYIIFATIVVAGFSSCKQEDFLDRFPKDKINEQIYFKSEVDLKLYANQFYTALPVEFSNNDNNSDNMIPGNRNTFLSGIYVVPASGGGWDWGNIRSCNFFLKRYEKSEIPEAAKQKYAAEVRFFRALFYWQKVIQFGAVPILEQDLTENSPELFASQNTHKEVMDFVLKDLDFAVANLTEPSAENRLNKYAALALKARICLWEGTFRKYHGLADEHVFLQATADAAQTIINSNLYGLYSTGNPGQDYRNLFIQDDLSKNKEAILSRIYISNINTTNYTRAISAGNTGYSKDFVRSYLCKDGLPPALSPLYAGDDTPENEVKDRDPRYTQTIATPGYVMTQNPDGTQDKISIPRVGTSATTTGYQVIKGRSSDPAQSNANQETIDRFIFRYAEVLLNYAEAKAELGQLDQTVVDVSINKLRARAGMPNMVLANLVADPNTIFPGVSLPLQEIRRERRVELAGDGFRFNDLLRWKAGKLIERPETILGMKLTPAYKTNYPSSQVSGIALNADGYIRVYSNITNRLWYDKMYLYPLPIDQLTLNGNLKQNPGW
ncbi:hypothetical protein TH53_08075 [Pedobacter lusitanus]|uniref:SusD protein n=1 Tax=Pedobacter lusitanus TaxID=1503925 RepID=A0A0D0GK19_9SPHI|nr:RagB/SusD family nutrient uptake outer membrane protein [Pedobacter lusitanus]KIO77602.1 hypothetical protein TH53_08075 [Pedobacter lusitanus]